VEDSILLGYDAMSLGNCVLVMKGQNTVDILRTLRCLVMSGSFFKY
jgi:hypothetical protein